MALRPASDGKYELIGDCYVHGISKYLTFLSVQGQLAMEFKCCADKPEGKSVLNTYILV